jgi:hypothetical protein
MNIEGDFNAKAVKPELGTAKNGKPKVRIEFEIVEGPHTGKRVAYDGKLDEKNIKWTKLAMMAVGWQGKTAGTFEDDVMKAAKVVPITVKIVTWENPETGKVSTWSAVDKIGRSAPPLEKLAPEKLRDVDSWFAEVPLDEQRNGGGGAVDDSDIPFLSCDIGHEPSAIARVIR